MSQLKRGDVGSPPPMRGKETIGIKRAVKTRITPAYAGKSYAEMIRYFQNQDHPRLCGEKRRNTFQPPSPQGSPPPMRGKVDNVGVMCYNLRITPAYAGKRLRWSRTSPRCWDHPRLCGEKTKKIPKQRYFFHQPASFSFSLQYT